MPLGDMGFMSGVDPGNVNVGAAYDAATNRAVAVHGQASLEGLEKVYGAGRVVREIQSRREAGGHGSN